ncbi:hypothetical protein CT690_08525 [Serratia plymuthica]|uniref:Uncharacterized protein n=2 Tax=Serratia plymuthica TaxID=82996 RepID=A0A318NYX5_SERPL|nr:hypothetical protein CT690_08525 [Serratia plymuthica]
MREIYNHLGELSMSSEGLPIDGVVVTEVVLPVRSTQQITDEAKSSLSADSAAQSADAAFKFSREAKAASAEVAGAVEDAKNYAGIAQSGADAYPDIPAAQKAITDGVETRRYFSVRSLISNNWVDEYENVNGIATPTGRYLSNGKYVDEIAASVITLLASLIETNKRTTALRQYQSDQWQWLVGGVGGASETAMAFDNDFGLWLAGLKSSIQDYIEQLMPKSSANRYVDQQYAIVAKNGIDELLTINNNGDIGTVGTDDVVQDRLNVICSTTFLVALLVSSSLFLHLI